jgi:hypothetical protein
MKIGNKNVITKNNITQTLGVWKDNINNFMLMSIYVTDRNGLDCKYVDSFTHRAGSIGAPSRRAMFIRGTNTKQWEAPKVAGRKTKANIFQKGSENNNNNNNNNNNVSICVLNSQGPITMSERWCWWFNWIFTHLRAILTIYNDDDDDNNNNNNNNNNNLFIYLPSQQPWQQIKRLWPWGRLSL